jgi:phenylpropionate dioxygenase-like ring-hydroxylating dioxygenase large terminal subunit
MDSAGQSVNDIFESHLDSSRVQALNEQVRQAARLPIARAITLPREVYVDPTYFRYEAEAVLKADWICIAHVSQLKESGSYVALTLLDEPLVALRGMDGQIRVLSRVCPHRASDVMPESMGFAKLGKLNSLVCPYHRWSFDFTGKLRGCPEMHRAENFEKSDWRLQEIRCELWQGFVFVNLGGNALSLSEQYTDFEALVRPWSIADLEVVIAMEWDCDFNWKVMIENWMESYHHLGTHHKTLHPQMPAQNTWTDPGYRHFVRAHLPFADGIADQIRHADVAGEKPPGFSPIPGLPLKRRLEWEVYVGFPCFMVLTAPDRVIWYRLLPESADRCRLLTTTLVTRESLHQPDYPECLVSETQMLREFHNEDMLVNCAVQKGLRSRHAVRGRLSHLEEPIWLIQRYLAARTEGLYPTPVEFRDATHPCDRGASES